MDALDVLLVEGDEVVDAELEAEDDTGHEQQGGGVASRAVPFGSPLEDVQTEDMDFFCDRLIKRRDPACRGFPGFWGCHWTNGKIYPFGSPAKQKSVASPTCTMVQQGYVGRENMGSTYRLLCKFQHGEEIRTRTGSAVSVSPHKLVTAGCNVQYSVNGVTWTLKEALVLSGEYVPVNKLANFGYRCQVLSHESIAFMSVMEKLPCYLLPCSPKKGMLLSGFGFPGAADFLRSAICELREDSLAGNIWGTYRDVMLNDIEELAAKLGDFGAAEKEARKLLLEYFRVVLSGMPDGVQACSAGRIEEMTEAFVSHACPCLPGSSGSPICPLQTPGYYVADHAGGIPGNLNIATSTENPKFVDGYMRYVLPEIPGPSWSGWSRPFFTISPFMDWIEKHKDKLPIQCHVWLQKRPAVAAEEDRLSNKRPGNEASTPRTSTHSVVQNVLGFEPERHSSIIKV